MTKKHMTEIVATIVDVLGALSSEERQRVVQASLTLLGDEPIKPTRVAPTEDESAEGNFVALPARARSWVKQNQLSSEQIQEVFHSSDDDIQVIAAEIPGKNNREKVRNAYVLCGIAQLLQSGEARFGDKEARALCESLGFFDGTNHMKYMKGNEFTGSKEKGWILTTPGLRQGAVLVKEMSGQT